MTDATEHRAARLLCIMFGHQWKPAGQIDRMCQRCKRVEMTDATGTRVWKLDVPIKRPTFRQVWREWRCGRRHEHGPEGFYPAAVIQASGDDTFRVWMQECQACGRVTAWSEREDA